MTGIQYITDDKGNKTGVLIDLKIHGAIWEAVYADYCEERKSRKQSYKADFQKQ